MGSVIRLATHLVAAGPASALFVLTMLAGPAAPTVTSCGELHAVVLRLSTAAGVLAAGSCRIFGGKLRRPPEAVASLAAAEARSAAADAKSPAARASFTAATREYTTVVFL
jgi:hypothetical protein